MVTIRNRKGFTLIEVIVVAGIIAILAGVLVPLIFNQIDESRIARAKGDLKSIQTAITLFKQHNSCFPNRLNGAEPTSNRIEVLFSEGTKITEIASKGWSGSSIESQSQLLNHLRINDNGYPAAMWKGPYLPEANPDPWGNAYMVGAKNFEETVGGNPKPDTTPRAVWIISAGPDGVIQTGIDDDVLSGDDIGIRFK